MEARYSTIEQVAAHYQVSVSTVRAWIRQNVVPFLKVGGVYRLKLADVEAAFKQQTVETNQVMQITAVIAPAEAVVLGPDQDV
jgi:excisionase family DNA binding protein